MIKFSSAVLVIVWCLLLITLAQAKKSKSSSNIDLCSQPHYSRIIPRLYLGNAKAVCNESIISKNHITHILTVQRTKIPKSVVKRLGVKTLFIRADDNNKANLLPYFAVANEFIEEGRREGAVFVHCHYGVSRSATLVTAYLMEKYGWSRDSALGFVRGKRSIVNPNNAFMDQLKQYEKKQFRKSLREQLTYKCNDTRVRSIFTIVIVSIGLIVPLVFLIV